VIFTTYRGNKILFLDLDDVINNKYFKDE